MKRKVFKIGKDIANQYLILLQRIVDSLENQKSTSGQLIGNQIREIGESITELVAVIEQLRTDKETIYRQSR